MAQTVKRLSTVQETWVRSLRWADPLEKEMAIHSSTISWKIPWTEEPWGRKELDTTEQLTHTHTRTHTHSHTHSHTHYNVCNSEALHGLPGGGLGSPCGGDPVLTAGQVC